MLFKQPLLGQPWVDCIFIRELVDWFEQCADRKKKKNTDCIFLEIILKQLSKQRFALSLAEKSRRRDDGTLFARSHDICAFDETFL